MKVPTLTCAQTSFLKAQHQKYKQHLRHDKLVRQQVGATILAADLEGRGSEMGVDLRMVRPASSDSATVATTTPEQDWVPAAPPP